MLIILSLIFITTNSSVVELLTFSTSHATSGKLTSSSTSDTTSGKLTSPSTSDTTSTAPSKAFVAYLFSICVFYIFVQHKLCRNIIHYASNAGKSVLKATKITFIHLDPSCEIKEKNGFMKYECGDDYYKYKCVYSDEYYERDRYFLSYDAVCSNDPHFYQMCEKNLEGEITNSKALCEHFFCLLGNGSLVTSIFINQFYNFDHICDFDCVNTDLDEEDCEDEKVELPSGQLVGLSEICNDVCDRRKCEDEAVCNGYTYGMYCQISDRLGYVPPLRICNGDPDCDQGDDEADCTVTQNTETSCRHFNTGKLTPVYNNTRCMNLAYSNKVKFLYDMLYCFSADLALYQSNCTDPSRVDLTCKINGFTSTVSKYLICNEDGLSICDDRVDRSCFEKEGCKVHKHLMCDNKEDCDNGADETHQICNSKTENTCQRRVGKRGELSLPISWIKDGIWDCENGADEIAEWETCGQGGTLRYATSNIDKCENVFVCRTGYPGYVELHNLCDGLETCGNENEICTVSSRSFSITTSILTTNRAHLKSISFCIKGMESLEKLKMSCSYEEFIYPDGEIFGATKTSLVLPKNKQSCENMYGELYVYTSCANRCARAICPLRNIPRYEVCPHQLEDRIGTIVDNEYLIFLTRSLGSGTNIIYTNNYFVCDDKIKCIDYSKVCDLVYDCYDGSDESQCMNHFKCETSGRLLPKTKKCDGHMDCFDLSDECNEQCSKKILKETILKGMSWLIGITAVAANLVIIEKSFKVLKRCRTTAAVMNRVLIILIALGDFLIGCYLCVIAIYDTLFFKKGYCLEQVTWITSFKCSLIGVLSTLGSQISLFSMAGLSIIRTHGIWNSMSIPGEVTLKKIVWITAAILSLVSVSAAIALLPIVSKFEDFFVNGLKFLDRLKIFIGTPDKATVFAVVQAYYGRTKNVELSWKTLLQMIKDMFSHDLDYEDLTRDVAKVDFYGNDGVCLFKYFVQDEDPQKMFVWSILALNFLCFIFISISYIVIVTLSRRSSKGMMKNNQQITQRNRRMNQRIAIIISTDFLCWVPFIITCILHSLELIDAEPWYSLFSMIVLPINSVINPFLYDGTLTDAIAAASRFVTSLVVNSALFQNVREWLIPQQAEEIELHSLEAPDNDFGPSKEKEAEK